MQYLLMITYSRKEIRAVLFEKLTLLLSQFRSIQHPFWRAIVLGLAFFTPCWLWTLSPSSFLSIFRTQRCTKESSLFPMCVDFMETRYLDLSFVSSGRNWRFTVTHRERGRRYPAAGETQDYLRHACATRRLAAPVAWRQSREHTRDWAVRYSSAG